MLQMCKTLHFINILNKFIISQGALQLYTQFNVYKMLKFSIAKKTGILLSNLVGDGNAETQYNFSANFPNKNSNHNKTLTY